MVKTVLRLLLTFLLLLLYGCGGGGGTQATTTASVALSLDKTQAIASARDQVVLTATVKDGNGLGLAGKTVVFNVPAGTYPYLSTVHSDANGMATITLKHPPVGPNSSAVVTVTATSEGLTSNPVSATFNNPQVVPAKVTLTADKVSLAYNGSDQVSLTATATDENGAPLVGQAFAPSVQPSFLSAVSRYTNEAGQAGITIYANNLSGSLPTSLAVTATINGIVSNVVNIAVTVPDIYPPQLP